MTALAHPPIRLELVKRFACFGGPVTLRATGPDLPALRTALAAARADALDVHRRLTRFDGGSELARLNADPRASVPASVILRRFADAVRWAGAASGGLVDATVLDAVEAAGYRTHFDPDDPNRAGTGRELAVPSRGQWRDVGTEGDCVVRPPGVRLDSGGLGKGLAADLLAERLATVAAAFVVDCGGDLRLGGMAPPARSVEVRDPFAADRVVHRFAVVDGAVATSGTTRRQWIGGHHLIDPRTGAPAATGIVQATALAPTGLEAEVRAKAALLAGAGGAAAHLPDGGCLVTAAGGVVVVPRSANSQRDPSALSRAALSLPA